MNVHVPSGGGGDGPPIDRIARVCADIIDIVIATSGRDCGFVFMLVEHDKHDCCIVSDLDQKEATELTRQALKRLETEPPYYETVKRPKP